MKRTRPQPSPSPAPSGPSVLLVNPNRLQPPVAPLALDYLADSLAAQGLRTHLLDLCFEPDPEAAIARSLASLSPQLIALTIRNTDDCYLAGNQDFLSGFAHLIQHLRRHSDAPIVLGGSGFSVCPGPILRALQADYGIDGDGEVPLPALLSALSQGSDLSAVPGLLWRDSGAIRHNPPWRGPLHSLPPRRRALLDNQRYFREGGQAGIETKRGCDRTCIYCADPIGKGRRLRPRTPAQVADEFHALLRQNVDHFHLCDSEFNLPLDHALAVCRHLFTRRLGDRARWYTYASPAGFTPELALAMRRAGCVGVNFGVDSADDAMLAALGRDFRLEDIWETARACRAAGLVFMFDLLLGGPGETPASLARTVEMMKQISPHRVGLSLGVRIYAGTPLSRQVLDAGPLPSNPNLRGSLSDNPDFMSPVFYLSADLGPDPERRLAQLVAGDPRFFFPTSQEGAEAYNYNDNQPLVQAIKQGYRGAYWDILRRLADGD